MGRDTKYGRVTFERGTIGEDEPVFVFRAQDVTLPILLDSYRAICVEAGSPAGHLEAIDVAKTEVLRWQAANTTQVPRSAGA